MENMTALLSKIYFKQGKLTKLPIKRKQNK